MPLSRLAAAHVEAAERLAATATETGVARLWRDAAGEAAARFCHELIDAARDFPPLPGRHYPALFEALAAGAVVRPAYGRHPRLAIWGLVEARLQQADLVVLGGLNEGTWPRSGRARPVDVAPDAAGIRHRPAGARDRHRRARFCPGARRAGGGADPRGAARGGADRAVALASCGSTRCLRAVGLDGALGPDDTVRPPRS